MLLFNSSISTSSSLYTLETGMLISERFRPVVQIGDIRGVMQNKYWTLSPSEWFSLTKGKEDKLLSWFKKVAKDVAETRRLTDGQDVAGFGCTFSYCKDCSDESSDESSDEISDGKAKKTVSFAEDTIPPTEEETDENTLYLGEFKILFDQQSVTAAVWKDKTLVIRLNEQICQELYRVYDIISLKLELLQKYQFYANYISSRYINHILKFDRGDFRKDHIRALNLENIPRIGCLMIDYSQLDIHVCLTLHAEIRTWALDEIFKTVDIVKSYYSKSWNQGHYLYL